MSKQKCRLLPGLQRWNPSPPQPCQPRLRPCPRSSPDQRRPPRLRHHRATRRAHRSLPARARLRLLIRRGLACRLPRHPLSQGAVAAAAAAAAAPQGDAAVPHRAAAVPHRAAAAAAPDGAAAAPESAAAAPRAADARQSAPGMPAARRGAVRRARGARSAAGTSELGAALTEGAAAGRASGRAPHVTDPRGAAAALAPPRDRDRGRLEIAVPHQATG